MVKGSKSSKLALKGVFCLPTSSKSHLHEPTKGNAFKQGQLMYLLVATQSLEEGGYPFQVVLTSDEPIPGFEVGAEVETQHAQVKKNLPPRRVAAVRLPDGTFEGDASTAPRGLGVPHWEFIPANENGSANLAAINATVERIAQNKANAEAAKEQVRAAKKTSAQ